MKKISLILLVVTLLSSFTLVACGNKNEETEKGNCIFCGKELSEESNVSDVLKNSLCEECFANTEVGTKIGQRLPSMELEAFDENGLTGEKIDLVTAGQGKVVVINFWGFYCSSCLEELPHFNKVASENTDDVVFYAIHYGSSIDKGMEYVKDNYKDSDMIFAKDTEKDEYYDLVTDVPYPAYPHTIVLNKDGIITYTGEGAIDETTLINEINKARG